MIIVEILGMDYYEAIDKTALLHDKLIKAYDVKENDLEFFAPQSFIIHDGMEQTSFRLNIVVEAPEGYEDKEEEVKNILFDHFKDIAIHMRVLFRYFDPEHEYLKIDQDYPEYMTPSNTVKAERAHDEEEKEEEEENYEEEYAEPYMGDIIGQFDAYVKEHPDAKPEEVYEVISGIRENVNKKHHQEKEDKKKKQGK